MVSKENDLYRYTVREHDVIIDAYTGDYPVVDFPKELDGIPVTELGAYVLSGKECEEVVIPEGITKIGRYGFYNCRKLRKLVFTSDFMDIGSGAFTGCHHIREIEVHMCKEQTCLKEVLVEVPEEVCVTLLWKDKEAVLWFPEYFEESIENTPARILSVKTHGSGMFYRNCFQGKVFQFQEYDKRFETACALEREEFLAELAYGRLKWPVELTEKMQGIYETYMREHREKILMRWIAQKREEALEWMLLSFSHTKEEQKEYQQILSYASEKGTTAMVSMLMEYGRKLFPPKRKSFEL